MTVGGDVWDVLHRPGASHSHWSTVNLGEALPGVASPLGWSIWDTAGERNCHELGIAVGAFSRSERAVPTDPGDRILRPFFGRIALNMEWLATIGDRMPGTTGEEALEQILGEVPRSMTFAPTRRRYPAIAWNLPHGALTAPRRLRTQAAEVDRWWRTAVAGLDEADLPTAAAVFAEAVNRFQRITTMHGVGIFCAITPLWTAVESLVARAGTGDSGVLSGTGGAEMAIIEDLWAASRGRLGIDDVAARHGFHGPLEGEMSSRVWREDPGPLRSLIEHYAARPDSDDPWFQQAAHRSRLRHMQREVAAGFPVAARPAVRALLRHAARTLPIRGVGKRAFLQALDVARASARRIGRLHTDGGRLNYPDDVFYLAVPEVVHLPAAARDLVELRRKRRAEYQHFDLPTYWRGTPNPIRLEPAGEYADAPDVVTGIGVSAGCVQGRVRVVTDPGFGDVQPGEILVAPSTDPSWASIMFISAGLVIDMGSAISHAAVVARELGLPCVVNTRTGTRVLRDGDLVSVDGTSGHVAVLERAAGRVEP